MPQCKCLVLIPNPAGRSLDYAVVAKTSREAAAKAMQAHPFPIPVDTVITVIADGLGPSHAEAASHNAQQPTFWHRAETVTPMPLPRAKPKSFRLAGGKRRKILLN